MKWFQIALRKYAVFSGRAGRKEYWMFLLFYIIFDFIAIVLDYMLNGFYYIDSQKFGYIVTLYQIIFLLPCLSAGTRRLHDIGKSGALVFFSTAFGFLFSFAIIPLNVSSQIDNIDIRSIAIVLVFSLIYCVFAIWLLVLLCRDGDAGENKYGPDPKQVDIQTP